MAGACDVEWLLAEGTRKGCFRIALTGKKSHRSPLDCEVNEFHKNAQSFSLRQQKNRKLETSCFLFCGVPMWCRYLLFASIIVSALMLVSCEQHAGNSDTKAHAVTVVRAKRTSVPITVELSGRVSAFRKAEVRPQVGGILQKKLFSEGALVKENQSLYKIDPALYAADVSSAEAAFAKAKAGLTQAELRLRRRRSLVGSHAVSKQSLEDAEAEFLQAQADLAVARAALDTAKIRLRYTDVLAPITGRIGKSNVTQGALVTAHQEEPLAVIHQLDPVYVDMTRSSLAILKVRERYASGRLTPFQEGKVRVKVKLDDEHLYPLEGTLQFSDSSVDESTGMVLLRAVFPNPEGTLLPGLYVRALVQEGIEEKALLIPQIAVQRSARGEASVFVVEGERVQKRVIETAERVGRNIVVARGISDGDMVVVEGMRGVREGMTVRIAKVQE